MFPGEEKIGKPYIQTHVFEVRGYYNEPFAGLVDRMRHMAIQAGVDAVIIMNKDLHQGWDSEDQPVEVSILSGLGVVLKENVDYLHNYKYLSQLHKYDVDKDTFELYANLYPEFDNQVKQVECLKDGAGNFYFANFIQKYSNEFLLEQISPMWRQEYSSDGKLFRRKYTGNTNERITFRIYYKESSSNPDYIKGRFYSPAGHSIKTTINFIYDNEGKLSEKIIFENGKKSLREVFIYDEWDRHITSEWYTVTEEENSPFLKVENYFYENEDVDELF